MKSIVTKTHYFLEYFIRGCPILLCTVRYWIALSISRLVAPTNFLQTVSIMLIPSLCSRKLMYGIPLHTPVSLLKIIFLPFGVVTTQYPFVWVDTIYPASSSMGMDSRLEIPLSFSHTLNFPYHPLVLVVTVPAFQLPFMYVLTGYTLSRNSLTKKV